MSAYGFGQLIGFGILVLIVIGVVREIAKKRSGSGSGDSDDPSSA